LLAPDEGRVEMALEGDTVGGDPDKAPRLDQLRFPFRGDGLDEVEHGACAREPFRCSADDDLARPRRLLQPLRDIDGVARHKVVAAAPVARDHLPGVDPDSNAERHVPVAFELAVEVGERTRQLVRRAHRPQRVVFMQARDAEDGHHGVADELLDGSAVALEDRARRLEIPRHHPSQRLRVEPFAQPGRIGHVRKQHRDRLPTDGHGRSVRRGFAPA
jgi:hypothetical protein